MALLGRSTQTTEAKPPPKLIGGFFWWFVFGICVVGDILDILLLLIEGVVGLTGIGLPISFFTWLIDALFDFFLGTVIGGYYAFAGAAIGRVLILASVQFALEQVPLLEVLPLLTVTFVLLRVIENMRRRVKRVAGSISRKVVPSVVLRAGRVLTPAGAVSGAVSAITPRTALKKLPSRQPTTPPRGLAAAPAGREGL